MTLKSLKAEPEGMPKPRVLHQVGTEGEGWGGRRHGGGYMPRAPTAPGGGWAGLGRDRQGSARLCVGCGLWVLQQGIFSVVFYAIQNTRRLKVSAAAFRFPPWFPQQETDALSFKRTQLYSATYTSNVLSGRLLCHFLVVDIHLPDCSFWGDFFVCHS